MRWSLPGLVLALQACAEDPFRFEVAVQLTPDITSVTADGEPVVITAASVEVARTWARYADARALLPIELVFFAGEQPLHTGHSRPGACELYCVYSFCPDPSVLVEERISITSFSFGNEGPPGAYLDFSPFDYVSMTCTGSDGSPAFATARIAGERPVFGPLPDARR